jgi:hypothetical protein
MTQTEVLRLALRALRVTWYHVGTFAPTDEAIELYDEAITAIKAALEAKDEPVAWAPYLSDRADGVQGHYAIARWNPRGYREVWNLRRHTWGAFSDDVMSLEEADYLLQQITIPTRKPTPPQRTWAGLTDEEQRDIAYSDINFWDWGELMDAVETKLKEKNGYE